MELKNRQIKDTLTIMALIGIIMASIAISWNVSGIICECDCKDTNIVPENSMDADLQTTEENATEIRYNCYYLRSHSEKCEGGGQHKDNVNYTECEELRIYGEERADECETGMTWSMTIA